MKNFSLRQMRREYRGLLRNCTGTAVIWLMSMAVFGAVMAVRDAETEKLLMLAGADGAILLALLGAYLILSDVKWLLKKTPYGQTLYTLGNPEEIMAEIDRDAEAFFEHHGSFILLRNWLVLILPNGWNLEPYRMCAYPIRQKEITEIRLLSDTDAEDPEKRHIQITCAEGTEDFYVYQQQDLDALREWMEKGGRGIHD